MTLYGVIPHAHSCYWKSSAYISIGAMNQSSFKSHVCILCTLFFMNLCYIWQYSCCQR